ncbi:hypothetical protein PSCICN_25220 [Pseudomonas cichorii]|nr:hypothetical protein PSCICN_25220 [Pseudomonas cichorii]
MVGVLREERESRWLLITHSTPERQVDDVIKMSMRCGPPFQGRSTGSDVKGILFGEKQLIEREKLIYGVELVLAESVQQSHFL